MTRIVAGAARGRRLAVPPGRGTRPTSERAREALFSAVEARLDGLDGTRWLDLYAGSGAVGLEALSRGAVRATLVEADPRAAAVARGNAAVVARPGAEVVLTRVERLVAASYDAAGGPPYDVVVADPPYAVTAAELAAVLAALRTGSWLAPGALAVVERATRDGAFPWPPGYVADRSRRYGEATLWYGRAALAGSAPTPEE